MQPENMAKTHTKHHLTLRSKKHKRVHEHQLRRTSRYRLSLNKTKRMSYHGLRSEL